MLRRCGGDRCCGVGATRRDELLGIAGQLFADRGLRSTTVRDIADTAGILSGSLYHHFDSKESMVDELLRGFLDGLFARYREIAAAGLSATETLRQLVIASFEAIDSRHTAVAIYQNEARHLASQDRFGYINERNTEFQDLWESVLRRGGRRRLPFRPRRRPGLPLPARHRVGRRSLVPARWVEVGR